MSFTARKNNDRIEIYENGSYQRCVTLSDLRAISCDGTYFAALRADRVELYACRDGSFIRTIDRRADSLQLSGGTAVLQVGARTEEYDVLSGNLKHIYG